MICLSSDSSSWRRSYFPRLWIWNQHSISCYHWKPISTINTVKCQQSSAQVNRAVMGFFQNKSIPIQHQFFNATVPCYSKMEKKANEHNTLAIHVYSNRYSVIYEWASVATNDFSNLHNLVTNPWKRCQWMNTILWLYPVIVICHVSALVPLLQMTSQIFITIFLKSQIHGNQR